MNKTMPKIRSKSTNNIKIVGDNILYNNGTITAHYILPTVNYKTASSNGIIKAIQDLTNLLSTLASQRPNVIFTIENIDKTIKAKDVESNLLEQISLYRPDFNMPKEFTENLGNDTQSYSLLCVDIQQTEMSNIEDYTIKDTLKELFSSTVRKLAGTGNMNIDEDKILQLERNIYNILRHSCVRASKELVFYNFVSKLYPSYDISYDKLSFVNETTYSSILGSVTQVVNDNFGWFELQNIGVDLFDLPVQTTYGCMLTVKAFPDVMYLENMPMDYPGAKITIECLSSDEARLKLKRARSSQRYELEQGLEYEAESEELERVATNVEVATKALADLDAGEVVCKFSCNILVTGLTKEEVTENVMSIISDCKDRKILISKSLNQAVDFLDGYVGLEPKNMDHIANLQWPLAFQMNSGSIVGDSGTEVFSPAIGEDL